MFKKWAFKNNYLVEIYLSNNIKNIAKTAFSNNPYLTTIVVESNSFNLVDFPWGAEYSNLYLLK